MSARDAMDERHSRVLAELSELGLSLARDLHARALAAEDLSEAAGLSLAFHRISRSVRQSLALEARLVRERERRADAERAQAAEGTSALRHARKARVRAAVERLVWTETEDEDEAERLIEDLGNLLDEEALAPAFLEGSVEVQIERIRRALGLAARVLAEPTPPHRSSA
jgi:hypothetical protein